MEAPSLNTIIVNVAAQVINLIVFFWLLKKFVAAPLISELEERKQLLQKLKGAQKEYDRIISEAKQKADSIISEANELKKKIIAEAEESAKARQQEIVDEAQRKAEDIIQQAKIEAEKIKTSLEAGWEEGVKKIAKLVVKKLLQEDVAIQDKYLHQLINEFKQTANE